MSPSAGPELAGSIGTCAQVIATLFVAIAVDKHGLRLVSRGRSRAGAWGATVYVLLWVPGVALTFDVAVLLFGSPGDPTVGVLTWLNVVSIAVMIVFVTTTTWARSDPEPS